MIEEKYPIGTEVYYSLEDYDSGEDVIYKGTVTRIFYHDLELQGKILNMKLYEVNKGLSMQHNAFYTLDELYKMANRLQYLMKEIDKTKVLDKELNEV